MWETEDESATAAQVSLPRPSDTPYRTPSRNSRKSSRRKSTSPPAPSSSPPPRLRSTDSNGHRNSQDVTNDESISILDPRRFTPTLHANLVSEILSLRRDQEEKLKFIENLEANLHDARVEQESLGGALSTTTKETRSLKRQLALLEGGTSSALGELTRERDDAREAAGESKKRLEVAQKKVRSQEEASDRVHELWARDKDTWDDDKRKYERRLHIAEGRLKAVLEEVAAYQATHNQARSYTNEGERDDQTHDSGVGHGSDTASVRSMSMTNSIRFSVQSGPNGYGIPKFNGLSLADELDLEDEEDSPTDHDGRESVISNTHRRTYSRESAMSRTHRRNQSIQSIESLRRPGSVAHGKFLATQITLDKLNGGIVEDDESAVCDSPRYVDTGVQYTPPPSPKMQAALASDIVTAGKQVRQPAMADLEIEANQRRKRVHSSPLKFEPGNLHERMVSAASQTIERPLSPPRTPKSPIRAPPSPPISAPVRPEMNSMSTQTEPPKPSSPVREAPQPPILIPAISIHPPTSRPGTPKRPLLPQYVKDAACQVTMQVPIQSKSVSVQTEEIRVDQRINMLPKHLQPSTISSSPPSPEPQMVEIDQSPSAPGTIPPRNPRRMKSRQTLVEIPSSPPQFDTRDSYPGDNDDGPLAKERSPMRRPPRISSLFAGFDNVSSDEADEFGDADLSDSDFRTALSAPRPKSISNRFSKRTSVAPTSVPEDVEPSDEDVRRKDKQTADHDPNAASTPTDPSLAQRVSIKSGARLFDKPLGSIGTIKQGAMRRTTLISNGIAAHQGRARSPSLTEIIKEPPFPIPTRASSRKVPSSASAPSDGARSPTRGGESWSHRRRGSGKAHYRANSIRKVKSGTSLAANRQRYRRHASRSPPPLSASTEAPESPQLPPMPNNEITSPFQPSDIQGSSHYASHRPQHSTNTAHTSNTGTQSINGSGQATSVVDAIAQTMVGEWMFKYVRRRKSFGVSEATAFEADGAANGARHKRWVWLAPYERAVMWSSKQPTSGTALLGKSGRKLTIQSVLDVKDDNPPPKGSAPLFNRSILILTPARALKFTTTTRERHYVWLTALSFLAHSTQAIPELISPTPPPIPHSQAQSQDTQHQLLEFDMLNGPTRFKRSQIRDSIRVAKSKGSFLTSKSGPPSRQGGEASIRTDTSTQHNASLRGTPSNAGSLFTEALPEAASPPTVPRFVDRTYPGSHGRKRSNTGSRIPPPLSFRGFSERGPTSSVSGASGGGGTFVSSNATSHKPTSSTAGLSTGTTGSSDIYNPSVSANSYSQRSSSYGVAGPMSASGISSIRTSDASARPGHVVNNFFDAVGTMRMEAFISPMATYDQFPEEDVDSWHNGASGIRRRRSREFNVGVGRRSRETPRFGHDGRRRRSRNRESFELRGKFMDDWYGGSRTAGEEEYGMRGRERNDDPFRGF
ncbi:MAG: hypothetical protein M1818_004442 [Claussenomyces sp. TS43310]|nr:MAG: hypothetical protein M1818_004442 [Claussenomyces sp. TS43310]